MSKMRVAVAVAAAMALAGAAQASAETYLVDGVPTAKETALTAQGGCSAAKTDGPVPCFSSDAAHNTAEREAVAKGETPPGWGAPASPSLAQAILSGTAKAAASRGPKAHKSDDCSLTDTHVWKDLNRGGIQGWFGGYTYWQWHSEPFYREVTSYVASNYWHPYWRDSDTTLGGGALYDAAYQCREVSSLANGGWNDRFTQFRGA
ncbi:MAG TPA: hypothetical protein VK501_14955 [Baekduia sp.]|uniref:hypothetical protein n=1 Tax=Baekduia sp. TaxID=2600305 RepID=UPI002CA57C75|nr:hypothetical protein [Baekduia sp.]HMJ35208.1 hypothetical protein [Baekduia sp.]